MVIKGKSSNPAAMAVLVSQSNTTLLNPAARSLGELDFIVCSFVWHVQFSPRSGIRQMPANGAWAGSAGHPETPSG